MEMMRPVERGLSAVCMEEIDRSLSIDRSSSPKRRKRTRNTVSIVSSNSSHPDMKAIIGTAGLDDDMTVASSSPRR